ncbi:hypothetical protein LEP1GSC161_2642 [Leptospira santarosai str. CBC1416]|uniref:Uncharacterized protein n=1 Tax=Leptospira santarosai str. CBC1416 TaxID=1193059 RepID=M6W676_9LEPT|nr:hypothetical protein LEP1GSC161_2642 [Leptospira santarosai str. CBC1416]
MLKVSPLLEKRHIRSVLIKKQKKINFSTIQFYCKPSQKYPGNGRHFKQR